MSHGRPHVLFVTKSDLSGTAGHNIATREIVTAFARSERIDLSLVCPEPRSESPIADSGSVSRCYVSERPPDPTILQRGVGVIDVFRTLRRAIVEGEPDAIVARMAPVFLAPPLLANHYDVPYILLSRGTAYKSLRFSSVLEQLYRYNVRVAEEVYVASMDIKRDTDRLRKANQSEATFLPNAVDPEQFYPIERETARAEIDCELDGQFVVGFVGSMKSYHRLDLLIRSLDHLDSTDDVSLLLIGDGPELDRYRELASSLGIRENVIFPGFVSHDQVNTYISACAVLYGVSDQDSATPVKIFEYLACARPVIVRDITEMSFVRDRDLGRLVERSSQQVGTAIQALSEKTRSGRLEMGRRGREYVEKNRTWDAAVDQVLNDFEGR